MFEFPKWNNQKHRECGCTCCVTVAFSNKQGSQMRKSASSIAMQQVQPHSMCFWLFHLANGCLREHNVSIINHINFWKTSHSIHQWGKGLLVCHTLSKGSVPEEDALTSSWLPQLHNDIAWCVMLSSTHQCCIFFVTKLILLQHMAIFLLPKISTLIQILVLSTKCASIMLLIGSHPILGLTLSCQEDLLVRQSVSNMMTGKFDVSFPNCWEHCAGETHAEDCEEDNAWCWHQQETRVVHCAKSYRPFELFANEN